MTTIVTRSGKGSALTYEEMDQNLTNIKTDIEGNASTLSTATTNITNLQSNAASQQTTINTHTSQIATLDANLGTATTNITTLQSNAASQQTTIDLHTTQIGDLQSNAASQQASIDHMPTLYAYVHNAEGATITKGQPVYLFEANGDKPSVKLAYNTSDTTSAKTLGLAAETMTTGADGWVMVQGQLAGLDTSAYTEGATLYLGSTAGTLTATKPYAPNHLVYVGVVAKANAGAGAIYIRIQNGYELDEIHDVQILSGSQTNNDILMYDSNMAVWRNKTIANLKANLSLASVATSGAYSDLSGTPSLATVATSGSYTDLTNKPTIPGQDSATANQIVYKNGSNVATGSSTLTFDGTILSAQQISVTNSQGDEGGEILLAKPATNSTISGTGVTIDVYQNKLRIFEQGGSARGAYIDLTAASAGVGTNLLSGGGGSTYGNTEVAAYLPTYTGSLEAASSIVNLWSNAATQSTAIAGKASSTNPAFTITGSGAYFDSGAVDTQVDLYGILVTTGSGQETRITNTTVSTHGNITAGITAGGFVGSGQYLTNIPSSALDNSGVTAGTYGDTTVVPKIVVNSKGQITSVSNVAISGGGGLSDIVNDTTPQLGGALDVNGNYIFTSNTSTGSPAGVVLVRKYPTSDGVSGGGGGIASFNYINPTSTTQASGLVTFGIQSNVGLQSRYGSGGNRTIAFNRFGSQINPITANTMNNADRVRSLDGQVDVALNGYTYGTMSSSSMNATVIVGVQGVANALTYGNVSHIIGMSGGAQVVPQAAGTITAQYATGQQVFVGFAPQGTGAVGNIVNARLISGSIFNSNTSITGHTVTNAIGLHIGNNWASPTGVTVTNKYAVLVEDANTAIQTNGITTLNGNLTIGSRTILGYTSRNANSGTTYDLHTLAGSFIDYSLDNNLTLQLNASPAPNMQKIEGRFVQDATGGRTVTWPVGTRFSGSLNTAAESMTMFTCYVINGGAHVIYSQVSL